MHTHRVVAAIDFGTHGSGYAWTAVDPRRRTPLNREIIDCTSWPDAEVQRYPKTLSALLLKNGELDAWGNSAAHKSDKLTALAAALEPGVVKPSPKDQGYLYLEGMKMSLRPADDRARVRPGSSGPDARIADPVPAIAMYLREVAGVAITEITRSGHYTHDDIRWCLTVPAIWDQQAYDIMRKAAAQAGLPSDKERLLLVPEPDAAALYCDVVESRSSTESAATGRGSLRPGTRFMVIDCGGGTADLVSYEVADNGKLEQFYRPGGGPFGAKFTTDAFLTDALAKRFGGVVETALLKRKHPMEFRQMAQRWEEQRNRFRDGDTVPCYVDIPVLLRRNLPAEALEKLRAKQNNNDYQIVLQPEEVCDLLDGVVKPILDQIDVQLSGWQPGPANGDMAFLVGGFANSPYLQDQVTEHLRDLLPVRVAPFPERAVLFGAVHYCYDPTMVRARRTKYTYGCNVAFPVEPDDRKDYEVCREGVPYTYNRFFIFVRVNQKVSVDDEVVRTVTPLDSNSKQVNVTFYSTLDPNPYYVTDDGVRPEGKPLNIQLGPKTMDLPFEERKLNICMKFGEAQVQARVVDVTAVETLHEMFLFESDQ